jgi:hypothetical protein
MQLQRSVIGLSIAVALFLFSATSQASAGNPGAAQISAAVRCLQQATLQWDFASNKDVLGLLRKAQDDLVAAARQQSGAQRMRTDELLADLNRAIERASTQLGSLSTPSGETFGPLAPSRNDLAQLASEGQDLERGVPLVHRLLLTVDVGSQNRDASPAHTQIQQADFALANSDLPSWPELQARWPQVHFRF